jgi:NTE family protein
MEGIPIKQSVYLCRFNDLFFIRMRYRLVFLFCWLVFAGYPQKVALVLSGGGAKGVTHIGVIRALEEEGIPISSIAGTSMGAIIGGLYASGYSPDDMERILNSEDFAKWVSGKLDQEYTYFFRQGQPDASWLSFRFKYDSVLQTQLPTNIVSPIRMDFAFLELFSSASATAGYDFDHLMVPFRCVASDVRNNKPYIMKQGELGSAIRASMTFPFYFKPIRIDGKLLFDGGMYNNFPADIALRDFDPDIIIGSKASGSYLPPDEDDVVSQLSSMLMGETRYDLFCDASVLIEPALTDVNVIDFSNTAAFVDSGYVATKRLIPRIREFVTDTVTRAMHDSIRAQFNKQKPELRVNSVEVDGLQQGQSLYVANAILGQVRERKSNIYYGSDLNIRQIRSAYFKVIGEDRLKSAYPRLYYDTTQDFYRLILDAKYEKGIDASFGGSLSSGATNEIFLQIKYSLWRNFAYAAQVSGYFGRFYNSALVGGRAELPGKKPKYFEFQYVFNQFNFYRTRSFFFLDDTPIFLYENNGYLRADAGFPLSYKGKIEAGVTLGRNRAKYFHTNTATESDEPDKTRFDFFSPYVEFELNTLNRKQYANQGYRLYFDFQYVGGQEKHFPGSTSLLGGVYTCGHAFVIGKFSYERYLRQGKFYRPGLSFDIQLSSVRDLRNYTSTTLYMPWYGPIYEMATVYQTVYRPRGYAAGGLRNVFVASKNTDFRLETYLMLPFREISSGISQNTITSEWFPAVHYVCSASFVYHSPIGPLSATLTKYDDNTPMSFFINIGYIIFNRPAF